MSAVAERPLLERVKDFMRTQDSSMERTEIEAAFPGDSPKVVRLTLGALRTQGFLHASVDGHQVFYSLAIEKRNAEAKVPLRKDEHRIPVAAPVITMPCATDKIVKAMEGSGRQEFNGGDVAELAGLDRKYATQLLRGLVEDGKVFAAGKTVQRRYRLTPFPKDSTPASGNVSGKAAGDRGSPAAAPAPIQLPAPASEVEVITDAADAEQLPLRRFSWSSDGSLGIDCERCCGELTKEDLRVMSSFINGIPEIANV